MAIDERAIIEASAKIADDVEIGPWSYIGADVEIGSGTWIGSHVVIKGPTKIGRNNKIFQFSSVGEIGQDLHGLKADTYLQIGDNNIIREYVTLNRGYISGEEKGTLIGNNNLFMACAHVAHDCHLGNHNILGNYVGLAGHIRTQDHVIFSAYTGVHQFCHIGSHSFMGAGVRISKDVLPYVLIADQGLNPAPYGINLIGLRRHGMSNKTIQNLQRAYKIIFKRGNTVAEVVNELQAIVKECEEVQLLIDALSSPSKLGILR